MGNLTIYNGCVFCGREWSVEVDERAYALWQYGILLAQEAFPHLSATERECLVSGICPKCQGEIFGE